MASFGQDFAKGFFGTDSLRDYTHASRVFTSNAYELKPRFKFLFHVSFTINTGQIPSLATALGDNYNSVSYVVKTADLPKFSINKEVLNQYNRKRIVQTKINYEPVTITFHDDGSDRVRNMWYNYMSYYYKDSVQKYGNRPNTNGSAGASQNQQNGFGGWDRDIYSNNRQVNDWGFVGESISDGNLSAADATGGKPPFFRDIKIYGFDYNHQYAEYVLINPIITNWQHDQYDYSQGGGIMQNTMTVEYESVKYYTGAPNKTAEGFANPEYYDTQPSPLARPGSTNSIFGQGGLLDVAGGISSDLQSGNLMGLVGAVQKAGTFYNTNKQFGGAAALVKSELATQGRKALLEATPQATRAVINKANGWVFPTGKQ